jgi:hypothetical protein
MANEDSNIDAVSMSAPERCAVKHAAQVEACSSSAFQKKSTQVSVLKRLRTHTQIQMLIASTSAPGGCCSQAERAPGRSQWQLSIPEKSTPVSVDSASYTHADSNVDFASISATWRMCSQAERGPGRSQAALSIQKKSTQSA